MYIWHRSLYCSCAIRTMAKDEDSKGKRRGKRNIALSSLRIWLLAHYLFPRHGLPIGELGTTWLPKSK